MAKRSAEASPTLVTTAYHEAGHPVMVYRCNNWIRDDGVTIHADGTGQTHFQLSGFEFEANVRAKRGGDEWRSSKWSATKDIKQILAGPLAEQKFRDVRSPPGRRLLCGGVGDGANVRKILRCWHKAEEVTVTSEGIDFHVAHLCDQVRRELARPDVWRAVEAVAQGLLRNGRYLDGEEAFDIIEKTGLSVGRYTIVPPPSFERV